VLSWRVDIQLVRNRRSVVLESRLLWLCAGWVRLDAQTKPAGLFRERLRASADCQVKLGDVWQRIIIIISILGVVGVVVDVECWTGCERIIITAIIIIIIIIIIIVVVVIECGSRRASVVDASATRSGNVQCERTTDHGCEPARGGPRAVRCVD